MQKQEFMLSTTDNPFCPFDEFDEWKNFDESKGYFTCGFLARIAKTSHELGEKDNELAIDAAIDEILEFNVLGIYCKTFRKRKAA